FFMVVASYAIVKRRRTGFGLSVDDVSLGIVQLLDGGSQVEQLLWREPEPAVRIRLAIHGEAERAISAQPGELGAIEAGIVVEVEIPEIVGPAYVCVFARFARHPRAARG